MNYTIFLSWTSSQYIFVILIMFVLSFFFFYVVWLDLWFPDVHLVEKCHHVIINPMNLAQLEQQWNTAWYECWNAGKHSLCWQYDQNKTCLTIQNWIYDIIYYYYYILLLYNVYNWRYSVKKRCSYILYLIFFERFVKCK